jgi:hypothetical protein
MRADRALAKISRDQEKWARALFKEKAAMDYSSGLYAAGKAGEKRVTEQIARNMKVHGRSLNQIIEDTGLSPEEIEKL